MMLTTLNEGDAVTFICGTDRVILRVADINKEVPNTATKFLQRNRITIELIQYQQPTEEKEHAYNNGKG